MSWESIPDEEREVLLTSVRRRGVRDVENALSAREDLTVPARGHATLGDRHRDRVEHTVLRARDLSQFVQILGVKPRQSTPAEEATRSLNMHFDPWRTGFVGWRPQASVDLARTTLDAVVAGTLPVERVPRHTRLSLDEAVTNADFDIRYFLLPSIVVEPGATLELTGDQPLVLDAYSLTVKEGARVLVNNGTMAIVQSVYLEMQ